MAKELKQQRSVSILPSKLKKITGKWKHKSLTAYLEMKIAEDEEREAKKTKIREHFNDIANGRD